MEDQAPAHAVRVIEEELQKLAGLEPSSSEFNVTRNYLEGRGGVERSPLDILYSHHPQMSNSSRIHSPTLFRKYLTTNVRLV